MPDLPKHSGRLFAGGSVRCGSRLLEVWNGAARVAGGGQGRSQAEMGAGRFGLDPKGFTIV